MTQNAQITSYRKKLGLRVKEIRHSRNVTQAQLAELLSISDRQIGQIEQGISFPSIPVILEMSSVLQVPIASFFTEQMDDAIFSNEWDYIQSVYTRMSEPTRHTVDELIRHLFRLESNLTRN